MTVHHRHDIGPLAVDFAVNEALEKSFARRRFASLASEIEFHDVVGGHECGRERAWHQKPIGAGRMAQRDVPGRVEYALIGKDAAAGRKILENGAIDQTAWTAILRRCPSRRACVAKAHGSSRLSR